MIYLGTTGSTTGSGWYCGVKNKYLNIVPPTNYLIYSRSAISSRLLIGSNLFTTSSTLLVHVSSSPTRPYLAQLPFPLHDPPRSGTFSPIWSLFTIFGPNLTYSVPIYPICSQFGCLVLIYPIWSIFSLSGPFFHYLFPIFTIWLLFPLSGSYFRYLIPISAIWFLFPLSDSYFRYLIPISTIWFLFSLSDFYFHYLIPISTIWFLFPLYDSYFHYMIPISTIWFLFSLSDHSLLNPTISSVSV